MICLPPRATTPRIPTLLHCLAVTLLLSTAACNSQATPESDNTTSAPPDNTQQAAEDARKAAVSECITKALNEAVLSPQNVKATLDSMMAQSLDGCPDDFNGAFVKLRTSVRDYAQTLALIEAHNKDQDTAVGLDALNLGCSLFEGKQCAPSSIQGWMDDDTALKSQDAENRAAVRAAYDAVEAVAVQHGVYIHTAPTPAPSNGG